VTGPIAPAPTHLDSDSDSDLLYVERRIARDLAALAWTAKYPMRRNAVLTPEQLALARAQLGDAAPGVPKKPGRREVDRHPLSPEQLDAARQRVAFDNQRKDVDVWLRGLTADDDR
jgi:hypothetical protein